VEALGDCGEVGVGANGVVVVLLGSEGICTVK
jgi:hypothetical protein